MVKRQAKGSERMAVCTPLLNDGFQMFSRVIGLRF